MPEEQTPEAEQRTYTIGYARASIEGLFAIDGLSRALTASWIPGKTVVRYGRRWILSRILQSDASVMVGRIGFVNDRELATLIFDENQKDFLRGVAPSGIFVPFGISLTDGTIAYQLRPGVVRETTFTSALQALLNVDPNEYVWTVEPLAETSSYRDWIARVERVTSFDVRLERPNPHYHGNQLAEDLIEEIRLEYVRLNGVEREGEGVNLDSELFTQAMDHVLRDYGRASIQALDPAGEESTWVKLRGRIGNVLARRRISATGPEDAPIEVVREAIHNAPAAAATVPVGDGDESPGG